MMIRDTLLDEGVDLRRVVFIPSPKRWQLYVSPSTIQFIRVFSDRERNNFKRFRQAGYVVQVLLPGAEKEVEAKDVRGLMESGGDWRSPVPPGSPG